MHVLESEETIIIYWYAQKDWWRSMTCDWNSILDKVHKPRNPFSNFEDEIFLDGGSSCDIWSMELRISTWKYDKWKVRGWIGGDEYLGARWSRWVSLRLLA